MSVNVTTIKGSYIDPEGTEGTYRHRARVPFIPPLTTAQVRGVLAQLAGIDCPPDSNWLVGYGYVEVQWFAPMTEAELAAELQARKDHMEEFTQPAPASDGQ